MGVSRGGVGRAPGRLEQNTVGTHTPGAMSPALENYEEALTKEWWKWLSMNLSHCLFTCSVPKAPELLSGVLKVSRPYAGEGH